METILCWYVYISYTVPLRTKISQPTDFVGFPKSVHKRSVHKSAYSILYSEFTRFNYVSQTIFSIQKMLL
jgi:hypothetical protein